MTNMNGVQTGNTVKVHYRGMLEDGTEFDSSTGKAPVQLEVGNGSLVPALEAALIGMTPGDTKTVTVIADEAYGQHQPELVQTLARDEIPAEVGLEIGAVLQATASGGETLNLTVVGLTEEDVVLDANHPLAGRDLTFELELVEIV